MEKGFLEYGLLFNLGQNARKRTRIAGGSGRGLGVGERGADKAITLVVKIKVELAGYGVGIFAAWLG